MVAEYNCYRLWLYGGIGRRSGLRNKNATRFIWKTLLYGKL